jgi:hypothetical protein
MRSLALSPEQPETETENNIMRVKIISFIQIPLFDEMVLWIPIPLV